MRGIVRATLLTVAVATLHGCAAVPKEAVDLSATVGRDLDAVHRAHLALLDGYFDRMESDINSFVDTQYRPYSIEQNSRDFKLVERLTAQPASTAELDHLDVLQIFVEEVVADIEAFRSELLAPVRKQRVEVRSAIETSYRRIQDAQAIVTGHLASVRRVHDLHEDLLAKADLQDLPNKFVDGAVKTSEQIEKITTKAKYANDKSGEFDRALEQLRKLTESMKD